MRKYITLAPSSGELDLIRAVYERARNIAVLDGNAPPSFSRFLVDLIVKTTQQEDQS